MTCQILFFCSCVLLVVLFVFLFVVLFVVLFVFGSVHAPSPLYLTARNSNRSSAPRGGCGRARRNFRSGRRRARAAAARPTTATAPRPTRSTTSCLRSSSTLGRARLRRTVAQSRYGLLASFLRRRGRAGGHTRAVWSSAPLDSFLDAHDRRVAIVVVATCRWAFLESRDEVSHEEWVS